jgi:hypothetical protein
MRNRISLLQLSFAVILFPALLSAAATTQPIDVSDPPMGTFEESWYAVMFNGNKAGYMHATMARGSKNGQDVIVSVIKLHLEIKRMNSSVVLSTQQETTETLAGEPVAFANTTKLGTMPITTQGKVKNGKVIVRSSQFGKVTTNTYDLPEGVVMNWGVYKEQLKHGMEPGTKYEVKLYDPTVSKTKAIPVKVEFLEKETIDLFGRKVETIRTKEIMKIPGMLGGTEMESVAWVKPENGEAVRLQMEVMSMPIEIKACSKSVALSENDPSEIMVDTLIEVEEKIDAADAQQITYRIKGFQGLQPNLPETAMQEVKRQQKDQLIVEVTRLSAVEEPENGAELSSEARERYLAATPMLNHKDPEVAKLVDKAVGKTKGARKVANALCRFVADYISKIDLSVGFATAGEVARSRHGDCTEYGVLLAALGRGAGIPTRVVAGLAYVEGFGGRRQIFGGHMWAQFWINGRWVDLDAAFDQVDVDPTHIALAVSDAGDSGIADLVSNLWMSLGTLDIEVLEVKTEKEAINE